MEKRGGLKDGKVLTLAEIGDTYSVTRERVRQIEAVALNKLFVMAKKGELSEFFTVVNNHLKLVGGLRSEQLLLEDLRYLLRDSSNANLLGNQIRFLLTLSDSVVYSPEDSGFRAYWYASRETRQRALGFITRVVKFLESKKSELVSQPAGINYIIKEAGASYNFKDGIALNYVSLSKHFHINQYGDFGLVSWSEVNPKTVRHWAYLVLKKDEKPLHFTAIAKRINQVKKDGSKVVNAQTVHNELIKDGRFVLVGWGIYGLQEFGLMPGTARQVIARLLKDHGPLKSKALLVLVQKERTFKDNTVLINLQNKKNFQRLSDGRYSVKEA